MVFHVKTYLAPSEIEGLGTFADEDIKAGTVTWRYDPPVDQSWGADEVAAMPEILHGFIQRYTYFDAGLGVYILCGDNARFMNHSDTPNVQGKVLPGERVEGVDVAARDIAKGEELTCDYNSFDHDFNVKMKLPRRNLRG